MFWKNKKADLPCYSFLTLSLALISNIEGNNTNTQFIRLKTLKFPNIQNLFLFLLLELFCVKTNKPKITNHSNKI